MTESGSLPIACTLSGASLEERAAWLERFGAAALIDGVRDGDRLELRFRPQAAEDVRELVRAESQCCSFLSFEVGSHGDEIRLGITGPTEAGPVLDALLGALRGGWTNYRFQAPAVG
jgi:hypothetical protein